MEDEESRSSSSSASDWTCERCTWRNSASDLTCSMCYGVRASSREVPVVWQWLAGEDWIPYDAHSIQQIEGAYQRGEAAVQLRFGYFAANDGYSISFRPPRSSTSSAPPAAPHHHQTNHGSGMRRRVRRLAVDEPTLFVDVSDAQRRMDGRCSICQEPLDPAQEDEEREERDGEEEEEERSDEQRSQPVEEEAEEGAAELALSGGDAPPASTAAAAAARCVRLVHCAPGHSFHVACVTSWIKLRDSCPACSTKI